MSVMSGAPVLWLPLRRHSLKTWMRRPEGLAILDLMRLQQSETALGRLPPPGHCTERRLKHISSVSEKEAYLVIQQLCLEADFWVVTQEPKEVLTGNGSGELNLCTLLLSCSSSLVPYGKEILPLPGALPLGLLSNHQSTLSGSGGQQGLAHGSHRTTTNREFLNYHPQGMARINNPGASLSRKSPVRLSS